MEDITKIKDLEEFKQAHKDLFSNHKATLTKLPSNNGKDCIISFKQDNTNVGAIQITYINGVISISGDYGSAVFNWHNPKNHIVAYLGMDSFGYVLGNMEASKDVMLWDSDLFDEEFEQWKLQLIEEGHDESKVNELDSPYVEDENDVIQYFKSVSIIDSYEAYENGCFSFGQYTSFRTYAIWYGFQEAVKMAYEGVK